MSSICFGVSRPLAARILAACNSGSHDVSTVAYFPSRGLQPADPSSCDQLLKRRSGTRLLFRQRTSTPFLPISSTNIARGGPLASCLPER